MNRVTLIAIAVVLVLFGQSGVANASTQHTNKMISVLEVAAGGCYFFKLGGVTEADPVVPTSPWFAIPTSQANAKEMYALLLSARLSGTTLSSVLTNDQVVCGHAQVVLIDL